MSSTAIAARTRPEEARDESTEPLEVLGLDAAGTAEFLRWAKDRENAAAADQLRAVTHWADLHPAAGLLRDRDPMGRERDLRLGGEGVGAIAEFAITEIATHLAISEPSARALVGEALELRDRLPRLWARVMSGALPPWRARRIAERTIPLPFEAAAYVDELLASFAHQVSISRIDAAVTAAMLRFDPDAAADVARQGAESLGVVREDHLDGTSTTIAVTETPDAIAVDAACSDYAEVLFALGDTGSLQARRAKAFGLLADPQRALDLTSCVRRSADTDNATAPTVVRRHRPASTSPVLHIHVHQDAVETDLGVARVAGSGTRMPVPLEAVHRWLAAAAPGSTIKVTPVVDLVEQISVDAYEHPPALQRQVEERDLTCCFPWCGRKGRFDIDHIEPYDVGDPDTGRAPPPGQTSTANSARLCRFHHRVKTHGDWRYHRRDVTTVMWRSPLGYHYVVDHTGTRRFN